MTIIMVTTRRETHPFCSKSDGTCCCSRWKLFKFHSPQVWLCLCTNLSPSFSSLANRDKMHRTNRQLSMSECVIACLTVRMDIVLHSPSAIKFKIALIYNFKTIGDCLRLKTEMKLKLFILLNLDEIFFCFSEVGAEHDCTTQLSINLLNCNRVFYYFKFQICFLMFEKTVILSCHSVCFPFGAFLDVDWPVTA